ncbi:MAG: hypothetical protein ACAI25_11960 [Planctomycetota bacterium]
MAKKIAAALLGVALVLATAALRAEDGKTIDLGDARVTLPGAWTVKVEGATTMATPDGKKDALVVFLRAPARNGKSLGEIATTAVGRFEEGRTREKLEWPKPQEGKTRTGVPYATQGSYSKGAKGELHLRLWILESGEGFRVILACAVATEVFEPLVKDATGAVEAIVVAGPAKPAAKEAAPAPRQRILDATFQPQKGWTEVKADGLVRPSFTTAVEYLPRWRGKAYQLTITSDGAVDAKRTDDRVKETGDDRFEPNDQPGQARALPKGYKGTLVSANSDYFALPEGTHKIEITFAYEPPDTFPCIITFSEAGLPEHHSGMNCYGEHTVTVKKGERFVFAIGGTGVFYEKKTQPVPITVDVHVGAVADLEAALRAYLLDGAQLGLPRSPKAEIKVGWKNEGQSEQGPFVQLLLFEVDATGWLSQRYGIAVGSPRGVFFTGTGLPSSAPPGVIAEVFEHRITKELGAACASLRRDEVAPARREDLEKWLVKKEKHTWSSASRSADKNTFTGHTQYSNFFFSVEWAFNADQTAERKSKDSGSSTGYDNSPAGGGRSTGGATLTGSDKGDGKMPFEVWEVDKKTWLVVKQAAGVAGLHALESAEKKFTIDGLPD